MQNCVVRTYSEQYSIKLKYLANQLADGWTVKIATPFIANGRTEYIEYILEREENNG